MATTTSHNKKSSAVKRILSEARELREPTSEYAAYPLEDNIFEWHFTLRGPSATEFEQGIYHGRILLPVEYPFRPPDVMILTPNGRWELNKKICLTFTGFHEEMWQPAWGIRTALIGVQAFMGARAEAAVGIGSLDYPLEERERLAGLSGDWTCPACKVSNRDSLPTLEEKGERVQPQLPDGLAIDPNAEQRKAAEQRAATAAGPSDADGKATTELSEGAAGTPLPILQPSASESDDSFASQEDFSRALPAPIIPASTALSQTSASPGQLADSAGHLCTEDKGKGRDTSHTSTAVGSSSTPIDSSRQRTAPLASPLPSTRAAASPPHGGHHTRAPTGRAAARAGANSAEASALRLAALDRAIATVICLLAALVLRRLFHAWS